VAEILKQVKNSLFYLVKQMAYIIFFVLILIWVTGSYGIYRFGLKAGCIGTAAMIYVVLMTSYVVGLFHNIGLYNTSRFSVRILLTYLLAATMICFYLVLLSVMTGWLIPAWKSQKICCSIRQTSGRSVQKAMMDSR
jgi:hypothetical protein